MAKKKATKKTTGAISREGNKTRTNEYIVMDGKEGGKSGSWNRSTGDGRWKCFGGYGILGGCPWTGSGQWMDARMNE